jgi:hypothetical protein
VNRISADEFEYRHENVAGGKKIPACALLTLEGILPVDGINMGTGTKKGFYVPTNRENVVGGTQSNFLMGEKVVQPKFESKKPE